MSEQPPPGLNTDPTAVMPTVQQGGWASTPTPAHGQNPTGQAPSRPRPSAPSSGPTYLPPVPAGSPSQPWPSPVGTTPPRVSGGSAASPYTTAGQPTNRRFTPSGPPGPPVGPGTPASGSDSSALSRWGWRALVSFVAGGLVAALGFGASQLTMDQESESAAPVSTTVVDTAAGSTEDAPVPVETYEPAAYVAQILGPSVVQVETDFGLGSGVVYRDGLILTNNHVIEGSNSQRIKLADGRVLPAEIVGTDTNTDIAVLSVGEADDLPPASLAVGEEIQVGQIAIAIGSPFQLQQSVTAGIVSAVDRPVPNREQTAVVAMIQTDAPINPGNSGGALADKSGRVIGINTSIQTDGLSGTNAGVGFAVPITTAARIADLLVAGEPIESGFLGVTGTRTSDGSAGVEIESVEPGSAADVAGLEVGDRVLSIDEAPVTAIEELAGLVLSRQAGDEVTLKVVRDGEDLEINATLGVRELGRN